jgi:phage tail sheath protein FI
MTAPNFGLQFIQVDDQPQPVIGANLDVVGIIGPCSTANPQRFPFDTPVLVFSNDTSLAHDLGTDGFILDAIEGINDQLADFEAAAQIVIVRTDYGTNADINLKNQQTLAKIMGQSTAGTGVWAFLKAPNTLYCTPRLICAPGYTGQQANSLDTLTINAIGVGYIPGQEYAVTFAQGAGETNGANAVMPTARAVADANGYINNNELFIDTYGAWFTVAPTATLPAPDGPPVTALPAQGALIFSRNPGVGATITLNGTVVAFVSGAPTGQQVQIGADLGTTLANLMTRLTTSADTQITANNYALSGGTVVITQKANGAAGNGYTLATNVTGLSLSGPHLTGGRDLATSANATLFTSMALGANPVAATLTPVLDQLIGHAIVESAGTGYISDLNYRTTLDSQRIIVLSGGCKVIDPISGAVVVRPLAPRMIGIMIARDFATGYPFHSAANQPIQGIVSPARTIAFNLIDSANEGQQLLAANVGIVARGLVGVETAISSGGFMLISTDNCGDDELWRFYNVKRGRDYIHLSLMPALRKYLGRTNITRQTIVNILATISDFLGNLKALEQIIDFRMNFRGSFNSASEIRKGHLTVGFQAEEPPVLKLITTMSARYKPAIDNMVKQIEQQLNLAA